MEYAISGRFCLSGGLGQHFETFGGKTQNADFRNAKNGSTISGAEGRLRLNCRAQQFFREDNTFGSRSLIERKRDEN